jgi:diadenosine tetraphosphatase ApaH/serine/threonine PP2A family protein phosphatase
VIEDSTFTLLSNARYIINPGSVGQPRDGDPRASFAVYDSDKRQVQIVRVPYDIAGTQKKILDAGFPDFLAQRLADGR